MQICKTQRKVRFPLTPLLTWFAILVFFSAISSLSCGYGMYHRVKKGETLYKISKKYNVPVEEIIKANKESPFRFNPDKLKPGDYVYIPLDKAKKQKSAQREKEQRRQKASPKKGRKTRKSKGDKIAKEDTKDAVKQSVKNKTVGKKLHIKGEVSDAKAPQNKVKKKPKKTEKRSFASVPRKPTRKKIKVRKPKKGGKIIKSGKVRLSFMFPIDGGRIISRFGRRGRRMHKGIDIKAPEGTPVRASEDGVVIFSGFLRGYGNVIIIKHEGNYFTVYAHNKYNIVKEGEFVRKGQTIAKVGRTGNATTPHLHFEIRRKTKPLNPLVFLK